MSSTPFGEHLKREREMRGVSLEEIAAATRISTRFLEAIENEQWDQLPGGVFNRGFIRSIARFLGLDEDGLVAEYALETREQAEVGPVVSPRPQKRRSWRPAALSIALIVVLAASAILAYHLYGAKIAAHLHRKSVGAATSIGGGSSATHAAAPSGASSNSQAPAAVGATSVPPGGAPAVAAPAALTLKVEAGKPAQVKIIADGKTAFEGSLRADEVRQYQANDSFEITTSESSALLLELNGQIMRPIGTPGSPGTITLTRSDLTPASGDSH